MDSIKIEIVGLVLFLFFVVVIVGLSHRKQNTFEGRGQTRRIKWDKNLLEAILSAKTLDELLAIAKLVRKGSIEEELAEMMHEELSAKEVVTAGDDLQKLITAAERAPKKGEARHTAVVKIRRQHIPVIKPDAE